MTRRNLLIDGATAAAVYGLTLAMLYGGGFGDPGPGSSRLDLLGVLLAAGTALPVALHRVSPLSGYAVTAVASFAMYLLHYPLDLPFGPLVAAFWVGYAYGGDPRRARRVSGLVAVNLFVPGTATAYAVHGIDLRHVLPELLFSAVLFLSVWLAGEWVRLRREQVAELAQRAAQAEREVERERRLAAAEERIRIARELHDSAGHAVNVILVQAGAARLLAQRDPEQAHRAVATIEKVAHETITEIDRLVHALREHDAPSPPVPINQDTLEQLLDRHRAAGLTVNGAVEAPDRPLPHSVAWAAYRILQEALTNAARHGDGHAEVAVAYLPEAMEIRVTNPVPVPATVRVTGPAAARTTDRVTSAATPGGAHGIVGMRERVSVLGGRLSADAADREFRLHAWLPYGDRE